MRRRHGFYRAPDWLMTELTAGETVARDTSGSVVRMKIGTLASRRDSLVENTLSRIRKNLGTDYVVVGSYAEFGAKSEGQIRLDLRLQDYTERRNHRNVFRIRH